MNNLTFDQEKHQYKLDGLKLVSVTQVIESAGLSDFSRCNPELLERASSFGTAIHKAIQLQEKGTLDMETLSSPILPYLNLWQAFCRDFGFVSEKMEYQVFNKSLGVAGTIDHIGYIRQETTLVDIKTGHPKPADIIQACAYDYLYPVKRVIILYLTDNIYKINELKRQDQKRGEHVFLSALCLYNFKKQEGLCQSQS